MITHFNPSGIFFFIQDQDVLPAREIQRLQDIDEAHSFNKPKMLGLFEEINVQGEDCDCGKAHSFFSNILFDSWIFYPPPLGGH